MAALLLLMHPAPLEQTRRRERQPPSYVETRSGEIFSPCRTIPPKRTQTLQQHNCNTTSTSMPPLLAFSCSRFGSTRQRSRILERQIEPSCQGRHMSRPAGQIDFDAERLRAYLWDFLVPVIFANPPQQQQRNDGVSTAWRSGSGYEGYDGFDIKLSKFKVRWRCKRRTFIGGCQTFNCRAGSCSHFYIC